MKKSMFLVLVVISLFCTNVLAQTYYTDFSLTENPISESGNWINGKTEGRDWSDVRTTSGHAVGTQTTQGYNDSTALVTGNWGSDQTVEATVYVTNQGTNCCAEIELRLRSSISTGVCSGYEILFSVETGGTYHQIVRWNGPLNDFTYLASKNISQLNNGDVVNATIVGTVITTYINNVQQIQYDTAGDSLKFSSGNPGIGFYNTGAAENTNYGFSDFMAMGSRSQPPLSSVDYTLTVQKSGTGTGTVTSLPAGNTCGSTCSSSYGSYAGGTVVKLSETPDTNSSFSGWSGACSGTRSCSVTMDAAKTVTATFVLLTPPSSEYTLTVQKSGTGTGTVTSSTPGIICGRACSKSFNSGTVVKLIAHPRWGTVFTGWSGGGCSGTGSCTVTMDAAKTVTANFRRGR